MRLITSRISIRAISESKGNRALEKVAIHNAMKANSRPWEYDTDAKLQAMLSDDPMAEIKQDPNDLAASSSG